MFLVLGIVAIVTFGWWLQHIYQLWGGVGERAVSGSAVAVDGEPERRPAPYDHAQDEELSRSLWRDEVGRTA